MKELLLRNLTSSKGRLSSIAAAAVTGWLVRVLAGHNLSLTPEMLDMVTVGVVGFVGWIIDGIVLEINTRGVRRIQEAIPDPEVKADGRAGDKTVAAVEEMAAKQVAGDGAPQIQP